VAALAFAILANRTTIPSLEGLSVIHSKFTLSSRSAPPMPDNYWDRVADDKTFTHPLDVVALKRLLPREAVILDFGCGYGRTLGVLKDAGFSKLYGVDTSAAMIERAQREHPGIDTSVLRDGRVELPDHSVDAVLLIAVFTCVPDDVDQRTILDEVRRVMKPDGLLCVSDFLIADDERNLSRYEAGLACGLPYGVFEHSEGVRLRHHSSDWLHAMFGDFAHIHYEDFPVATMNGNQARGFQFLGRSDSASMLRTDAIGIWQAGVDAVRSDQLVEQNITVDNQTLVIADQRIDLSPQGRLIVVGGGKAGAGMARGFERAIGDFISPRQRIGWINVPADCIEPTDWIHLHPARPAGINEPTPEGVTGTQQILEIVETASEDDVCIVLLSGGGSALLPAPLPGITLEDKLTVTRLMSSRGATIAELNCVRRHLSRIKGGGLLRACKAGTLIVLIISDVIGDPLETIASGPTVPDPTTSDEAAETLARFVQREEVSEAIWNALKQTSNPDDADVVNQASACLHVTHQIIGNNATAVDAASREALRLGYKIVHSETDRGGEAAQVGRDLAQQALSIRNITSPLCIISGGEPVVSISPDCVPGKGGRNQELVVAALDELRRTSVFPEGIVILSGGTDGEDGPTDAAGGIINRNTSNIASAQNLVPADFLTRHDSYCFLEATESLLRTGPTHTNVMDLRIVLIQNHTD